MSFRRYSKEEGVISEYEQRIRDLITEPRRNHTLSKDKGIWLQLVSSLDVIGDT
jgi:hypothetical protein